MDPISRLTILGAAGGIGKEKYWVNRIEIDGGSSGTVIGKGLDINTSGDCAFVGSYFISGQGTYVYLASLTKNGAIKFQKTIFRLNADNISASFNSAAGIDSNGNCYVNINYGGFDIYGGVLKFNSSGSFQWAYRAIVETRFQCVGVEFDENENPILGTSTRRQGSSDRPGMIVLDKTNGSRLSLSVVDSGEGPVYLSRRKKNFLPFVVGAGDGIATRLYLFDFQGNWTGVAARYDNFLPFGTFAKASATCDELTSEFYCTGTERNTANPLLLKIDTSLNVLWSRKFSPINSGPDGVDVDKDGNVYVLLRNSTNGYPSVLKYNSSGTLLWSRKIIYAQGSIDQTNNLVVSGDSLWFQGTVQSSRFVTVKLPTDGSITGTFGDWTIQNIQEFTVTSPSFSKTSLSLSTVGVTPTVDPNPREVIDNTSFSDTLTNFA